jgi:tripartite-type tricarboxylate transporter receptor subunit TctC
MTKKYQLNLIKFLCVLFACCSFNLFAQAFPTKPIRFIVTYPAGGSSDLMGRLMAKKLNDLWGQPIIVENKGGAAGSIGMEFAARQPADGYAFVLGNIGPALINPLEKNLLEWNDIYILYKIITPSMIEKYLLPETEKDKDINKKNKIYNNQLLGLFRLLRTKV